MAPLAEVLEKFRQDYKQDRAEIHDMMDLDNRLTAQGDQFVAEQEIVSLNRESISLFRDTVTFQRCITIQLSIMLMTQAGDSQKINCSSGLVDYVTGMDEADLLSAQRILPAVYRTVSRMDCDSLLRVLEDLGEKCLQSYEMERCEASHGICISMMTGFVASWTDEHNEALSESAMDLYSWFMEALLVRKRASPKIYIILSELIQAVLDARPSYGNEQSLLSPRTSLFTILQEGDVQVKFSVAGFIPSLFERFLLKDHDAIFDDVLGSLPRDPEWVEGIALRLFVLSRLASDWHTLLRRCIYHMFETPAQVPVSVEYAQKCMESVSKALGLRDARELFRLFASQILYTWMETQPMTSIPFSIFGYGNLKEMLLDVKDEVVGQMMMRAKESEMRELADYLEIPHTELLENSFHKAEAYCIARDITTPPEPGSQPKGVEVRMRKLLGADSFMAQAEKRFPETIATFFKSLDRCDQIERAFSKRPNFQYALDIQNKIAGKSAAQSSLPVNQQPSFRARYLLDELDFLCKRVGFELESIWTPVLASFVSRSLLETIHPALGSLHTCSVIRKIRILVCLCGPVMLEGYPFEMLLHALRPFLSDVHCSEDTLGVFWYLLEAGQGYLKDKPDLVAGVCLATFLTLRKLFSLSHSSTTQHSQFESALTNAQKFHQWLRQFAEDCRTPDWDKDILEPFSQMLDLAQQLSAPTRSKSGPSEKDLVLQVLKDQDAKISLLQQPIADLVLSLLCPEFKNFADDDANSSVTAFDPSSLTVSLWRTLQKFNGGSEYRLWAARVIGRSFACSGTINKSLLREQDLSLFSDPASIAPHDAFCFSKSNILQVLCQKLQIQDHLETGLIERTLQVILSNITDSPDIQGCAEIIPESLLPAFIWHPYTCPQIPLSATELELSNKTKFDAMGLPVTEWARDFSLSLSSATLDDPVLGALRKVLAVIPDLAVQMMPYIVHDALLVESDKKGQIRQSISDVFRKVLSDVDGETIPHARLVISCILYLRNQPRREELTIVERDRWLDIDYSEASSAAHRCGLQKTSLLFLEIEASRVVSGSRRSSAVNYEPPLELLHDVFKNIDDPDLFYGVQQSSSLTTVMERLEYESSGFKNLLFQSAQYDSEVQMSERANPHGVLKALNSTNLQGIANTMLSAVSNSGEAPLSFDSTLQAATSLQQWDVPMSPLYSSPSATVFRAFQSLDKSSSLSEVNCCIDECLLSTLNDIVGTGQSTIKLRTYMRALGIMTEINDVLQSSSPEAMHEAWETITARSSWLKTERYAPTA
jgi:ataxia telangiectasia mutated family protein